MKKIIFALILLVLIPTTVLAWDDCPYNKTNCFSPGDYSRYVDINNDEICDRSQPAPENINNANNKQSERIYHLLPISIIFVILYFITFILSKKKIISAVIHKKIWNILLLISFLISGMLGILLIIRINFSTIIILPFNVLFWHVEIGTIMFIVCILHIIERWHYFKNLFKKLL